MFFTLMAIVMRKVRTFTIAFTVTARTHKVKASVTEVHSFWTLTCMNLDVASWDVEE
jgi:hypothetical protein